MGRFKERRFSYIMQAFFVVFAALNVLVAVASLAVGDGWDAFIAFFWAANLVLMVWAESNFRRHQIWRKERAIVLPPNWPARNG
jgi:hypothetical protein